MLRVLRRELVGGTGKGEKGRGEEHGGKVKGRKVDKEREGNNCQLNASFPFS